MNDKFEGIKEGDVVALRYGGLWHQAEVEKVQERFIQVEGMKFTRESGRQSGIYIHPAYAVPMSQEIRDTIEKRHLVAELGSVDWAEFSANDLRDIHMTVEYVRERKNG